MSVGQKAILAFFPCVFAALRLCVEFLLHCHGLGACRPSCAPLRSQALMSSAPPIARVIRVPPHQRESVGRRLSVGDLQS